MAADISGTNEQLLEKLAKDERTKVEAEEKAKAEAETQAENAALVD
jgi:hypothetical protein